MAKIICRAIPIGAIGGFITPPPLTAPEEAALIKPSSYLEVPMAYIYTLSQQTQTYLRQIPVLFRLYVC